MIDNKPETAEQPKPEVVQLGQRFQIFKSERTIPRQTVAGFESSIILTGENLPPIKVEILTGGDPGEYPITPLNPGGYQITQEDLSPETRLNKKVETGRGKRPALLPEETSDLLSLWFICNLDKVGSAFNLNPAETLEVIKRLRLVLTFPIGSFVSHPDNDDTLSEGSFSFTQFYPPDTGPLPYPWKGVPGESLAIPNDREKIKIIQGLFVLAPEEPMEGVRIK